MMVHNKYTRPNIEKFEAENSEETTYENRMFVMKLFDAIGEKPSPEEIDKYARNESKKEILKHIIKNYERIGSKKDDVLSMLKSDEDAIPTKETLENKEDHDAEKDEKEQTIAEATIEEGTGEETKSDNVNDDQICFSKSLLLEKLKDVESSHENLIKYIKQTSNRV